jgi:methylglutaconyl-CoA hydratase
MENQPYVHTNIENGIATVEFFHPKHNSLPGDLLAKIANTITDLGENDAAKVIILKSGGSRTFCAGASFDELLAIKDEASGKVFFSGFANVINSIRKCPKFVIGRVQGKSVGGGVGVASATDYCMATKFAAIKLSELALGFGPFVIGPAVERKMGKAAFVQLAINSKKWQTPDWAKANGLYNEVFESTEALDEGIQALAEELAAFNPEAMKMLKKVLWEGTEHWDTLLVERAAQSGQLVLSEFAAVAIGKFRV